ncbi:MAG: Clp protease N-terminal domain-containing protein [Candidatus Hydrogenedentota bacterium]
MEWEKLSFKIRAAVEEAIDTATECGHSDITSLHMLQALLHQDGGVLTGILDHVGAEPEQLHAYLESAVEQLPRVADSAGAAGLGQEFHALVRRGWEVAHKFGDDHLAPEHLVLAMVETEADQGGAILREQGVSVFVATCFLFSTRKTQ